MKVKSNKSKSKSKEKPAAGSPGSSKCGCGCGAKVTRRFKQGHDMRMRPNSVWLKQQSVSRKRDRDSKQHPEFSHGGAR
jgi:hypothetical protein